MNQAKPIVGNRLASINSTQPTPPTSPGTLKTGTHEVRLKGSPHVNQAGSLKRDHRDGRHPVDVSPPQPYWSLIARYLRFRYCCRTPPVKDGPSPAAPTRAVETWTAPDEP